MNIDGDGGQTQNVENWSTMCLSQSIKQFLASNLANGWVSLLTVESLTLI